MLVFIDESGCSGFKFGKGSSKYFNIGLVIFNDLDSATLCDNKITNLRDRLSLKINYEFHFKKDNDKKRLEFINTIKNEDFYYYIFSLDKELIFENSKTFKQDMYKTVCGYIFENAKDKLYNAKIIIDKTGGTDFKKELSTYLQRQMNADDKKIKKVVMQEGHKNNLIQLADYITSIYGRYMEYPDKNQFYQFVDHRLIYHQIWPKRKKQI